ncbi:hypothetical protein PSHT_11200 [Puccinia striiformis]|uniref:Uncharacterized protein n=1 Tax=Puccinia striiformis TaxID=27350 RepID=A0A2S4V4P3_9BASI|nr:hypothetical protein PSHT_11200 [Puccinia striiformis]
MTDIPPPRRVPAGLVGQNSMRPASIRLCQPGGVPPGRRVHNFVNQEECPSWSTKAELLSPTNNMSSDDRIHAANRSSKTKVEQNLEYDGRYSMPIARDSQAFRWTEDKKRDQDQDDTKEDKAVETQQDFDGELEDVKDAEESDSNAGEDGDDEEGDDEIKDGIGMVDPLESGAVDGKFWEGGHDDGEEPESNEAELSATENQTMPKDFDLSTAKENTAGGEQSKAENQRPRDEITGGEYGQLVRRRS